MNKKEPETAIAKQDYEDVIVSVANPDSARQLIKIAKLITTYRATFHIMHVTKEDSFPERERSWRRGAELVEDMTHFAQRIDRTAKPLAATSSSIPGAIVEAAEETGAGMIMMGWFGTISPVTVRRSSVVNKVLQKAPCDVGIYKTRDTLEEVDKVVIPVGPNNPRSDRLAIIDRLLKQTEAEGDLIHVVTPDSGENPDEKAGELLNEVKGLLEAEAVNTKIIHANSVLQGLLSGSEEADIVVIGPGREWVFNRFLFGRTADNLTNRVDTSVLMFKGEEHKMVAWPKGLLKAIQNIFTR